MGLEIRLRNCYTGINIDDTVVRKKCVSSHNGINKFIRAENEIKNIRFTWQEVYFPTFFIIKLKFTFITI